MYFIFIVLCMAGFSLSRALFRKNVGALPTIRISRLNSHDTHSDSVVIIDILLRTRITQNRFLIIVSIISGILLCCNKICRSSCGALFVGPLFGRTC